MKTASTIHSIATHARTLVLAGTLTLASFLPSAVAVYADADSATSTPTPQAAPVLAPEQAFDVEPGVDLENVTAVVVAGDNGVAVQAKPSADSDVVETLTNGTPVDLRIDMVDTVYTDNGETRWWPVEVGDTDGWINGQSLMSPEDFAARSATSETDPVATSEPERTPFEYWGELDGAVAEVDADGMGLSMRAEPDGTSEVVTSLKDGTIVNLRIADTDTVYDAAGTRWWPVEYDGFEGWVSGFYLIEPGAPSQSGTAPGSSTSEPPTQSDDDYVYKPGDWAVVRTPDTNRTDIYASASASAEVTGNVPHMALAEVVAQAPGGWYEIRWDKVQGFIHGDLLTAGTAPRSASKPVSPTPTPAAVSTATATSVPTEALVVGDIAVVSSDSGAGVNVRSGAAADSERVGFLDDKVQVTVISGPEKDAQGKAWYKIESDDTEGWVRGDLLKLASSTSTTTTSSSSTSKVSSHGFILPLAEYRFTQDYGCSNLGFYSYNASWGCAVHDGIDLAAPQGTPLLAIGDGEVVYSGWADSGLGYYVEIDHGNGIHSIYGHMASQPPVKVGDKVTRGQEIGPLGSTGLSTGPHVHFMIREDGVTQDPKNYLPPIQTSSN